MHDLKQPSFLDQNPYGQLSNRQQIETLLKENHNLRECNKHLELCNHSLRRELKALQDFRDRTLDKKQKLQS